MQGPGSGTVGAAFGDGCALLVLDRDHGPRIWRFACPAQRIWALGPEFGDSYTLLVHFLHPRPDRIGSDPV